MLDADGRAIELGRGALGATYKALDVDLRCPVTLKVISERYLGDESAQFRFLREAGAAASVRHPNVASVFHLGRTASSYFYAMRGQRFFGEASAHAPSKKKPSRPVVTDKQSAKIFAAASGWGIATDDELLLLGNLDFDPSAASSITLIKRISSLGYQAFELKLASNLEQLLSGTV